MSEPKNTNERVEVSRSVKYMRWSAVVVTALVVIGYSAIHCPHVGGGNGNALTSSKQEGIYNRIDVHNHNIHDCHQIHRLDVTDDVAQASTDILMLLEATSNNIESLSSMKDHHEWIKTTMVTSMVDSRVELLPEVDIQRRADNSSSIVVGDTFSTNFASAAFSNTGALLSSTSSTIFNSPTSSSSKTSSSSSATPQDVTSSETSSSTQEPSPSPTSSSTFALSTSETATSSSSSSDTATKSAGSSSAVISTFATVDNGKTIVVTQTSFVSTTPTSSSSKQASGGLSNTNKIVVGVVVGVGGSIIVGIIAVLFYIKSRKKDEYQSAGWTFWRKGEKGGDDDFLNGELGVRDRNINQGSNF
ncbi:uncharacterized protein KQ657_000774 [Scheffersomyces spartinae]|uniref:Mid2 domain-containing protein n=1 Tax=Scheffersomyces spartinae TaxID=45513 RepID=A0A9P7V8K3_9ASCO|nr:uncharacterized protein KQ657_000774 [Scheffersomyces spartinae]KAG7193357.1 hypothetical protein KQ657_000774 [Scheffersomyces spartinae]